PEYPERYRARSAASFRSSSARPDKVSKYTCRFDLFLSVMNISASKIHDKTPFTLYMPKKGRFDLFRIKKADFSKPALFRHHIPDTLTTGGPEVQTNIRNTILLLSCTVCG